MPKLSTVERLDKWKELYVMNMTGGIDEDSGRPTPMAVVVLNLRLRNEGLTVNIPAIRHPVRLFPDLAPEAAIRESSHVIDDMIRKGYLKFVSRERAEKLLSKPEVAEAVAATLRRDNDHTAARKWAKRQKMVTTGKVSEAAAMGDRSERVSGPKFGKPDVELSGDPIAELRKRKAESGDNDTTGLSDISVMSGEISPRVLGIMSSCFEGTEAESLRQLKQIAGNLTPDDFAFIKNRAVPLVSEWAEKRLLKLRRKGVA